MLGYVLAVCAQQLELALSVGVVDEVAGKDVPALVEKVVAEKGEAANAPWGEDDELALQWEDSARWKSSNKA